MQVRTDAHTRPVWAEVSVSALESNYRVLQRAAGVPVLAVVKANAYGHDARACAPVLAAAGAPWLGVTSVEEGIGVRQALGLLPQGMAPRSLVMCGVWAGEAAAVLQYGLTPVVWEPYHLDLLEAEARRLGVGFGSVPVHVEVDTGMARQGVAPGALLGRLLERFTGESPLRLEGVMTHYASAEIADNAQNERQTALFTLALEQVRIARLRPELVHVGNSSGVDSGYAARHTARLAASVGAQPMTRAGLALYGYTLPLSGAQPQISGELRRVLTWKTRVVSIREVERGATVGYNATFVAPRPMRLALLPVGYADGFRRALSRTNFCEGGYVRIAGQEAAIVGRVSMDLSDVDVSALPEVSIGDEVELIGEGVSAEGQARLAGTTAYEVLCGISDRVPRVLVE